MPALKARIGGAWVNVGGADEVYVGATAPTDPNAEMWYDPSAVTVGAGLAGSGIESLKPATPTTPGFQYFATDTKRLWLWDGTAWQVLDEPWQNFTPTLVAGVTVAKTVAYARYMRQGRTVFANVLLNITGVGTAGNRIEVGLPPFAAVAMGGNPIYGTFGYFKVGVGYYAGFAIGIGTVLCGQAHGLGAFIGQSPSFTTANGDAALYSISYEAA